MLGGMTMKVWHRIWKGTNSLAFCLVDRSGREPHAFNSMMTIYDDGELIGEFPYDIGYYRSESWIWHGVSLSRVSIHSALIHGQVHDSRDGKRAPIILACGHASWTCILKIRGTGSYISRGGKKSYMCVGIVWIWFEYPMAGKRKCTPRYLAGRNCK